MKEAILYKKLEKKRVKCLACSHYCTIDLNKSGMCGVRRNINGKLFLLVYGRPTGLQLDPIEKKPLYHFFPGTEILSLGTTGCNFGCEFCLNWESSQLPRIIKEKTSSVDEQNKLIDSAIKYQKYISPEDVLETALDKKIKSIAFTYNEPTIFFEYAYDIAKLAKKAGIKIVSVSNGYESKEYLNFMRRYIDAINIDIKGFTEKFYIEICKAKLQPVLNNVKNFHKLGKWVEITTVVIPGKNDSKKELENIAKFIFDIDPEIPWHITAFMPDYKMLNVEPTPQSKIIEARKIGLKIGLKYVYAYNSLKPDFKLNSTFCPKCGKNLIKRIVFKPEFINIIDGKCKFCGEKIKGVWS